MKDEGEIITRGVVGLWGGIGVGLGGCKECWGLKLAL